uniref:Uncharacterized protein n=1 Tax=Meloidogyne enterolobii TaxID=390850 RepID=A0A6V7XTL0_MELEN|nr:unnamed protein product [Meloidogyne enterolobii]
MDQTVDFNSRGNNKEAMITNDRDGDTRNMLNDDCSVKAATPIEAITIAELEEVRAFIIEQRKKKEAAEARRRRSITKSSTTLSSVSSKSKPPSAKKMQIKKVKKTGHNDGVIKAIVERNKNEENIEPVDDVMMDYEDEEDDSEDPDPNEIVDLDDNEEEYKKMKSERQQRAMNLVPEGVLDRAQILKEPRKGLFIYQCNDCREDQKKREYFLFKSGSSDNAILTIELCAEDLDKNILLGMYYSGPWGQTTKNFKYDQQTSSFEKVAGVFYTRRGPNIARGNDNKLLSLLKLCWILHQCDYCSRLQTSLANDLFFAKMW